MKKIIILTVMLLSIILIKQCPAYANETFDKGVRIWYNEKDEEIDHRTLFIGGSEDDIHVKVLPKGTKYENVKWWTDDSGIAQVTGDADGASVVGKSEGTTKLHLSVETDNYGTLTDSCIISVCTNRDCPYKGAKIINNTKFYRGASTEATVRDENVKKGLDVDIIGVCGKYFYINVSEDYEHEDGRENTAKTYVSSKDVKVYAKSITLKDDSLILNVNQSKEILFEKTPYFSNDNISFFSDCSNVIFNKNKVKVIKPDDDFIRAKSERDVESNRCDIQVLPDKMINALDNNNTFKIEKITTDLDGNHIYFTECNGASEYIVLRKTKKEKKWTDVYYSYNNTASHYRHYFDPSAKLGVKYKYKVVGYYQYTTYKNGQLEVERLSKFTKECSIKTGLPKMTGKADYKNGKIKCVKLNWEKRSYDYNNKKTKGGYVIYRKCGKGKIKTIKKINNKTTTSFKDKNVKNNKKYYYYIKAYYIKKITKKKGGKSKTTNKKTYSPRKEIGPISIKNVVTTANKKGKKAAKKTTKKKTKTKAKSKSSKTNKKKGKKK